MVLAQGVRSAAISPTCTMVISLLFQPSPPDDKTLFPSIDVSSRLLKCSDGGLARTRKALELGSHVPDERILAMVTSWLSRLGYAGQAITKTPFARGATSLPAKSLPLTRYLRLSPARPMAENTLRLLPVTAVHSTDIVGKWNGMVSSRCLVRGTYVCTLRQGCRIGRVLYKQGFLSSGRAVNFFLLLLRPC